MTQKYRFHNQNLNTAVRVKFNKLIHVIDGYLKNICQAKGISIDFDLNAVK